MKLNMNYFMLANFTVIRVQCVPQKKLTKYINIFFSFNYKPIFCALTPITDILLWVGGLCKKNYIQETFKFRLCSLKFHLL